MLVNVGVIQSIMGRWPKEVQENWRERLEGLKEMMIEQTSEVQDFAQAYDEGA